MGLQHLRRQGDQWKKKVVRNSGEETGEKRLIRGNR